MKRHTLLITLIFLLTLIPARSTAGATTTELIISEYIEGSSFNKAIEIYNGTGAAVDLTAYSLELYSNGSATPSQSMTLTGTLVDGDVHVVAHGSAASGIQDVADSTNSSVINFNGDDAVVLRKDGSVIDVIGQVGFDPGTAWGTGDVITVNHTLQRKDSICSGDNNPDDAFDPALEWNGFAQDTFDGLGTHTADCNGVADSAPYVLNTTPADAAVNVALDANIQITFSEAVDVADGWFGINCSSSGSHTAAVSGELTSYTFDPDSDFAYDESCTVTVLAANVSDQDSDDPPDNMEVNFVFSFNTIDVPVINSDLVINEIDYDQAGTDAAEFVELRNNGTVATDLTDWTLELINGTGGGAAVYGTVDLSGHTLAAGDYFVICANTATVENCDLDISPDTNLIQNGAPDAVALWFDGTLIDTVSYEGDTGGPYTEGSGIGLQDDPDIEAAGISRYPDGVDTDSNNLDLSQRCSSPGEANLAGSSGCVAVEVNTNLVINEIDYDQPGTDTAEFVELRNNGTVATDLTDWTLELINGTGGGAAVYGTVDLSGHTLAAGDYFVICANTATVENCDLDISPDTNLIQNGAPDAVALWFDGTLIDTVSYEGDTGAFYTEGSGVGLVDSSDGSISRCEDGVDTNVNNVDFLFTENLSPGAANVCTPPPPPEACGDPYAPIFAVQGSGLISPLVGTEVAIEGIVVGDFQNNASLDNGNLNGFHVQDPLGDGNPATSDGIFVYAPGGMDVAVGDAVRVRGSVSEYNGLTEITAGQIWLCPAAGNVLPTALSLPVTNTYDFEAYEGMLVTFPQELIISEYFNFDRFGEIVLTSERHLSPTSEYEPGPDAIQAAQEFLLDRITLDDGRTNPNPDPAIHPNGNVFDLTNLFRGGDTVQNVTGVIDYSFGQYRIQPTKGADYVSANPRPAQPGEVGGSLMVASFNVLNYFSTIDEGSDICGPGEDQECRGADTPEEFTRQRDKIIAAISATGADILGLIEIENNINDEAVKDLIAGLNLLNGAGTYDYVPTGPIGTDAIKVALIYKPGKVTLVGDFAVLDSSVDPRFIDTKNRPSLAQTFMDNTTGGIFTAVVNHLKSKGSDCNDIGDYDLGDGAGNCNLTRTAAVEALVDWLALDPTGSGDADFLIIGDLNAYDKEDPIDALIAGGYRDLVMQYNGEDAYSYVFDGQVGYLDHALARANSSLIEDISGVTVWHINADEPDLIDYDMSFKEPAQAAIYSPDFYRSSDHDPVLIGMDICDEIAPTLEIELSPDILWPPNHKYVEVTATVLASDNFDTSPVVSLLSVTSSEMDDAPGGGDGSTVDDIVIVDDYTFQLRAERSARNKYGRIYTFTYQVEDACGNMTVETATVVVPFNQMMIR